MEKFMPSYCPDAPSEQTAADIFKGYWKSAFPKESGIRAGTAASFEDSRVPWVGEQMGGMHGKSVLELGPFEAYHTWQFSQLGSHPIVAIEGNNINYLKCLVVKELFDIRAKFLHGDICRYLESTLDRFDLCWACGVLYHQTEPLTMLKALGKVSDALFIWTHFFDEKIEHKPEEYPHFDSSGNTKKELDDYKCTHYYRSYRHPGVRVPTLFSGGSDSYAYWLCKEDILSYLNKLGFEQVVIRGINMEHKAGPTMSLFALRKVPQRFDEEG